MDAGTDVAARTLRLLALLPTRSSWTGHDLAARLEVSGRTLRRDLRRLADLGYEVDSRPGPGGHYRLAAGARVPPMAFNDDEVVALVTALRALEHRTADDATTRALHKLSRLLPRRLAGLANAATATTLSLRLDPTATEPADALGVLAGAAAHDLMTHFSYVDRHGTTTRRRVSSLMCLLLRDRWTVLGWDHDRHDWRIFRLDRVSDAAAGAPTPRRPPPGDDLTRWLTTDFGRQDDATPS